MMIKSRRYKINIFYIDHDPYVAASMMVDRHVVKMILESAQLLSTAHRIIDGVEYEGSSKSGRKAKRWKLLDSRDEIMYSATHINHPSAVWCRASIQNYNWLVEHLYGLMKEYEHRYCKQHKVYTSGMAYYLQSPPFNLKEYDFTIPPSAMDKQYIVREHSPLENYRNYYKQGKQHLHRWTRRSPPEWIN